MAWDKQGQNLSSKIKIINHKHLNKKQKIYKFNKWKILKTIIVKDKWDHITQPKKNFSPKEAKIFTI